MTPLLLAVALFGTPGPPAEPAQYVVEAASRSETVYLLPPGPRTLVALEVEPTRETADAWAEARLRLYWDGEGPGAVGVDVPLGLFFGRAGAAGVKESSMVGESRNGASWVNRFPMPYRAEGRLRIDADRPIKGRLRLLSTPGVAEASTPFRAGTPPIDERGTGRVVGAFLLGPPASAQGRLVIDGRDLGPIAEALGVPGREAPAGDSAGAVRGSAGGKDVTAAYRWMAAEPVAYHRSLKLGVVAGRSEAGPPVALFWYSERPGTGPTAGRGASGR